MNHKTIPSQNCRFPDWRKPPLPGLQGLVDSVLHRVGLQSCGGEKRAYGAFYEEVRRSLNSYQTQIIGILTTALQPIQAEYQDALRDSNRALPDPPNTRISDTSQARAMRDAEKRRGEAAAAKETATKKARILELQMRSLLMKAQSKVEEAYHSGECVLVLYSKWTKYAPLEAEIPHIPPCDFSQSCGALLRQAGISLYFEDEEGKR